MTYHISGEVSETMWYREEAMNHKTQAKGHMMILQFCGGFFVVLFCFVLNKGNMYLSFYQSGNFLPPIIESSNLPH